MDKSPLAAFDILGTVPVGRPDAALARLR